MRRRWPVVLPIALLTLLVGALMAVTRSNAYSTTSTHFLATVSSGDSDREPLDPLVVAQLAPAFYGAQGARADVAAQELIDTFEVAAVPESPVVRFTVGAPTAELAVDGMRYLVALGPRLLEDAFGAAAARTVDLVVVTPPDVADVEMDDDGTYTLTATVSVSQVTAERGNPFPPSATTLEWLYEVAADPMLARQIEEIDSSATFIVAQEERRVAPILRASVTASSEELALEIHAVIVGRLQDELEILQDAADVRSTVRTGLLELLPPSEPERTPSSVVRALAGLVVLGGGFAVGGAIVADAVVRRRRAGPIEPTGDGPDPMGAESVQRPSDQRSTAEPEKSKPAAVAAAAQNDGADAAGSEQRTRKRAAPRGGGGDGVDGDSAVALAEAWRARKRAAARRNNGGDIAPRTAESNGQVAGQTAEEPVTPP